ncbi:translocon-associated protein subunit gamma isoform X1 [Ovis aries]|uniref:Signal sequence receptor subunit 3 n=1 Tax=Ovis aries TaxID=9940 RepID=A0AC11EVA5_SHEEP|nr:translocon-associated protein subunit gamma isoform X1 [Ovis aries]
MAPKGGPKQQSEEDLLLQDFSRNLSAKSSALFFGNAFIVSAIPIWLYWRIWHMDLIQSAVLYSVMTLVSTYLVAFAYKNVKFVLKHKVAQKREDAVSKEVTRKLSEADNRKMSRKEKDERTWVSELSERNVGVVQVVVMKIIDFLSVYYHQILSSREPHEVGAVVFSTLRLRNLRYRELGYVAPRSWVSVW